jgi:hypothetical protein
LLPALSGSPEELPLLKTSLLVGCSNVYSMTTLTRWSRMTSVLALRM